jgi:hypothetical protein
MNAYWFNPRNGQWWVQGSDRADQRSFMTGIPAGPDAPVRKFDPPGAVGDGNDWVLVLKAVE